SWLLSLPALLALPACNGGGPAAPVIGSGGSDGSGGSPAAPPGNGGAPGTGGPLPTGPPGPPRDAGTAVPIPPAPDEQAERARIAAALGDVANMDTAGLLARYPAGFASGLSYDPMSAANLNLIRGSRLGLSAGEQQVLAAKGFVISDRNRFP